MGHPGPEILVNSAAIGAHGLVAAEVVSCSIGEFVWAGPRGSGLPAVPYLGRGGPPSASPGTLVPKFPGGLGGGTPCGEVAWVTSATSRAALTVVMCRTRLCATSRVVRCRLTLVGRHRHLVRAAWLKPWKWMPVVSAKRRRISAWVAAISSAAIWVGPWPESE